jgi:hypothetical protein
MTGAALLSRFGLRPTRPSSAIESAVVGQIYFGDQAGKWVRFKSALTVTDRPRKFLAYEKHCDRTR